MLITHSNEIEGTCDHAMASVENPQTHVRVLYSRSKYEPAAGINSHDMMHAPQDFFTILNGDN